MIVVIMLVITNTATYLVTSQPERIKYSARERNIKGFLSQYRQSVESIYFAGHYSYYPIGDINGYAKMQEASLLELEKQIIDAK